MIAALIVAAAVAAGTPLPRATPAPRDAVRFAVEGLATPDGYVASFWSATPGFTVDLTNLHVDLADAAGAILARDVPHANEAPAVQNGPPGPNETVRVVVHVTRARLRAGMQTLLFRAEHGTVLRGGVAVDVSGVVPNPTVQPVNVDLPDGTRDVELQQHYAGAAVHTYGSLSLRCGLNAIPFATVNTRPHSELRVLRLRRARGTAALLKAGSQFGDDGFAYKAVDPLEVSFEPARAAPFGGVAFSIPQSSAPAALPQRLPPSPPPAVNAPHTTPTPFAQPFGNRVAGAAVMNEIRTHGCRALDARFAGAWDLERALALGALPSLAERVGTGMSHEEVAYLLGFPSIYATKDELLRMPEWRYERPAPFSAVVTFEGDRVVKYQPPGMLP